MDIPEQARQQDGVFTRSQARTAGWGDRAQRRLIRQELWIPMAGPVLRHHQVAVGPWQLARAVHLSGGLVVSHATAGLLWQLTVPAALHGIGHVERRGSVVRVHRLPLQPADVMSTRGLRVTTPERTLRDLMCSLRDGAGVEMLADAFRRGLLTARDVDNAAGRAHGRHGVTRARQLAASCRLEPHSVLEWTFHGLCDALGPGWRFNVSIHDGDGFIGRVDALHEATGTVVELDGRRFHGERQFQADRTRDQRLAALGHVVIRLTWDDVEQRPMEMVERIRRTVALRSRGLRSRALRSRGLGRPSRPDPDRIATSRPHDSDPIQDRSRPQGRDLDEPASGARKLDESAMAGPPHVAGPPHHAGPPHSLAAGAGPSATRASPGRD